jgi:S-adenosylmethionine hydrolase
VPKFPLVSLTTDFGFLDAYVGVMKGVILGIAPQARIVDISHDVEPQNLAQAAFLLQTAYRYFPAVTIHVGVVDPGVGTARRAIAVQASHGTFVGPDNGIFCAALADQGAIDRETGALLSGRAVALADERYWLQPVSRTFHGRDIFAPVAAHLARGADLASFGPAIATLETGVANPVRSEGGKLYGSIVHIDRFGNAISNLDPQLLGAAPVLEVAGLTIHGLAPNYQQGGIVALVGSSGLIEIAEANASAARTLGLGVGDPIVAKMEP